SEKERRAKAHGVLELVNLVKFRNAYVHELSGGMKQKVALARALVMEPQVLLMDEPFAALDAQTRATLHEELQQAWLATKKTIVFVTHNIEEAVRLADRVVVFSSRPGRICREIPVNMARPRESYSYAGIAALIEEIAAELKSAPPDHAKLDLANPDRDRAEQDTAREEWCGEGYSQKGSVSYASHSGVAGRLQS
ncbi:MAG TPA: hypothetical protein DCX37_02410, partial [Firmicutes bacterium]|nr:hypothetical protein [Bacillota bacterium]HBR23694.1 hypothetical protein [Bacillota bacterium]HCF92059.1 hypothetical protein [Bacillota bacterium]HCT37941.1 hypothetical protein [Bacillota bacterium]